MNAEERRSLLAEVFVLHSDLDPVEWDQVRELFMTEKYKESRAWALPYCELGKRTALQRLATHQLETKFSPLSTSAKERLTNLSVAQIETLLVDFVKAESLQELGLAD